MIYNGALIAYHQSFGWKAFFTKPLRFVIQLFTGEYSHIAIYIAGKVYELVGAGLKISSLSDWVKEHEKSKLKCYFYNLRNPFDSNEEAKALEFIESVKNVKYDVLLAMISPIDNSVIKSKSENSECADFGTRLYEYVKILKPRGNGARNDPNELIDRMNDFNLLEGRVRIK